MPETENDSKYVLEYQLDRGHWIMELKCYNCGNVKLTKPGQKITVSKTERDWLLTLKSSNKPIFKEVI